MEWGDSGVPCGRFLKGIDVLFINVLQDLAFECFAYQEEGLVGSVGLCPDAYGFLGFKWVSGLSLFRGGFGRLGCRCSRVSPRGVVIGCFVIRCGYDKAEVSELIGLVRWDGHGVVVQLVLEGA